MFVVACLNVSEGTFSFPPGNLQLKVFDTFEKADFYCEGLNYFYSGSLVFVPMPESVMDMLFSSALSQVGCNDEEEIDEDGVYLYEP